MSARPPSPIHVGHHLVTGHFRAGRAYGMIRERGTSDWLLIHTVAGGGRFGFASGEHRTAPGDIIILRPGTPHDYRTHPAIGSWELLWAHLQPLDRWLDWLDWPELGPGLMGLAIVDLEVRRRIEEGLRDMHAFAVGPLKQREDFAINALERVLLWASSVRPGASDHTRDGRIRQAMERLCRDLANPITISDLARSSGLSVSRFAHLFRLQAGMSVLQYREQRRLARAGELLAMGEGTIGEIAAQVGFDDPFYFSTRFKRTCGVSPRAFRQGAFLASDRGPEVRTQEPTDPGPAPEHQPDSRG